MPAKKSNRSYIKPVALSSMTPARRRVAIAKDVIAGLKAKRLVAEKGRYCLIRDKSNDVVAVEFENVGEDAAKFLKEKAVSCEVCALGGLFVAAVEKFDAVKLDDGMEYDHEDLGMGKTSLCSALKIHFDGKQLERIEKCFEGWGAMSFRWMENFPDPTERMKALMTNIIRNNGRFVPSDVK